MTQTPTDALRLVPVEPTEAVLTNMAIRFDHGLGCPGYYDNPYFFEGPSHARRFEAAKTTMRQLYEEVVLSAAAPASPLPGGGSNHLGNLLARIHRDGGHRQEEVGTDQACDEAELIVARLLQNDHQWRRIDTFAGSGQGDPVIVAVPTKEGGWIVGEAWKSVMEADDPYRGNDGWWWAGTSPGDAYSDPIRFMNHGDAEWWMPLPAAPTGDA